MKLHMSPQASLDPEQFRRLVDGLCAQAQADTEHTKQRLRQLHDER
jgi:hypothetical protein